MGIDRGAFTPPPSSNPRSYAPKACKSENRKNYYSCSSTPPATSSDLFHVIHKVPAGDSPYVRAKRVQLIEKDPSRAISLFWSAINSGDRVDSALKDMAVVMKQLDRSDEAIEAIKSFRHLCSRAAQESLDNILIELYKRSGRLEEQVEILQQKVKRIEEEASIGGKRTKMARSQGKKVHITVEQEYSRLLGNLAWAHLQQNNYKLAEEYYRWRTAAFPQGKSSGPVWFMFRNQDGMGYQNKIKGNGTVSISVAVWFKFRNRDGVVNRNQIKKALSIELDRNKQCNLAVCLMYLNRIKEAKLLLQAIKASAGNQTMDESYAKSYERAHELLDQIESHGGLDSFLKDKENHFRHEREYDCQSQVDHIDDFCGTTLCTPLSSTPHLFTQPINRNQSKTAQASPRCSSTGSKRYQLMKLQSKDDTLVFGSLRALKFEGSENSKSSANSPLERNAGQEDDSKQQQQPFFPGWSYKSGKKWADIAEEEEEEELNYALYHDEKLSQKYEFIDVAGAKESVSAGTHSSSRNSVRRSLSFENEEKQDTDSCGSSSLRQEVVLSGEGSTSNSKGTPKSRRRLQVFQDITPAAAESPRA